MASITFHLANFPLLSQNNEDLSHLYPNVNSDMDCVPTSIAAALTWFTGQQYYGDEVIDQVYGSGYTGGTAASAYEAYCAARNVKLSPVNGTPQELVTAIHIYLHENAPVLVTVPGQWNNPATSGTNPGDVTHVMVVCGDGAGLIQVMNPWTGAFETYTDSWFQLKLCYGQVWPMEGKMIPDGWHDDGTTLTAPNGVTLAGGYRRTVLNPQQVLKWDRPWNPTDWPLAPERHCDSVEPGNPAIGGGSRVDFRMTSIGYTVTRDMYQIYAGQDVLALESQNASLQQQMETVAEHNAGFQQQIATLTQQVAALKLTQGGSLTPELVAVLTQIMPHLAGVAASAPVLQSAFAAATQPKPQPVVTTPLPAAQNPAA